MAGKGGYQPPAKPAVVSGPGSLSRRTDGGPTQPIRAIPGLPYGQGQEVIDQQRQAPLPQAAGPTGSPTASAPSAPTPAPPTPLSAPSQIPDQPVTHGADSGPGPGTASLGLTPVDPNVRAYTSGISALQAAAAVSPEAQFLLAQMQSKGM